MFDRSKYLIYVEWMNRVGGQMDGWMDRQTYGHGKQMDKWIRQDAVYSRLYTFP